MICKISCLINPQDSRSPQMQVASLVGTTQIEVNVSAGLLCTLLHCLRRSASLNTFCWRLKIVKKFKESVCHWSPLHLWLPILQQSYRGGADRLHCCGSSLCKHDRLCLGPCAVEREKRASAQLLSKFWSVCSSCLHSQRYAVALRLNFILCTVLYMLSTILSCQPGVILLLNFTSVTAVRLPVYTLWLFCHARTVWQVCTVGGRLKTGHWKQIFVDLAYCIGRGTIHAASEVYKMNKGLGGYITEHVGWETSCILALKQIASAACLLYCFCKKGICLSRNLQ